MRKLKVRLVTEQRDKRLERNILRMIKRRKESPDHRPKVAVEIVRPQLFRPVPKGQKLMDEVGRQAFMHAELVPLITDEMRGIHLFTTRMEKLIASYFQGNERDFQNFVEFVRENIRKKLERLHQKWKEARSGKRKDRILNHMRYLHHESNIIWNLRRLGYIEDEERAVMVLEDAKRRIHATMLDIIGDESPELIFTCGYFTNEKIPGYRNWTML